MEGRGQRPAQRFFSQAYLFQTERLSMGRCRVLLMRTAIADVGTYKNQGGSARLFPGSFQRAFNFVDVVSLSDPLHVPAESGEAG